MTAVDEALQDAVTAALRERHGDRVTLTDLRTLAGGRSGVTLTADVGGLAMVDAVVVKAAPPGRRPVGRHDVLRQARVMDAVASVPGVVVPEVLAVGTEPVHFVAMTCSAGEAVEPVLAAGSVRLPAGLVRARAECAAGMLAALHHVTDIPARPDGTSEPVADLAAEVARWRATSEATDPEILVGGALLAELLEKHLPSASAAPVLVHGDFRLGNLVFTGPTPTGLIDWEIWGITQPGVDIGWFLVFCNPDLFPGIGELVDGMPTSAELVRCYTEAGGAPVTDLEWFEAFGRFKMAAIMAHNLRRHREGRHHDPFQETLPPTIARLVKTGIALLGG
jgi:streptomycin 6-kinase